MARAGQSVQRSIRGERGLVARSAEKIRAVEAFPMTEREIELARQSRIAHDGTLPGAPAFPL